MMKCSIYEPGWIYSKKDLLDMIIDNAKFINQMERIIEFCDEEDKRIGETDECREIARRSAKHEIAVYQAKIDEIRPFLE